MVPEILTFLTDSEDYVSGDTGDYKDLWSDPKEMWASTDSMQPSMPNWWANGKMSKWNYSKDISWQVRTEVHDPGHMVIIQPFRTHNVSRTDDDVKALTEIFGGIFRMARKFGFHRFTFVLSLEESYEDVLQALDALDGSEIKITGRSGMALYADMVNRRRINPYHHLSDSPYRDQNEALEDSGIDYKEVYAGREDKIFTLDEIKAASPLFFNRRSRKFHGTKKIYKYGNFLVCRNIKDHRHDWGRTWRTEGYVIYEFIVTEDNPQGFTLWRGETDDLSDAKKMIKTRDFSSWRDRVRRLHGLGESRPFQIQTRTLSKKECSHMGYDISEMQDFPVMRSSVPGSFVDYEESDTSIWILYIETDKKFQKQGLATLLLDHLRRRAEKEEKTVIHGTFTEEGEQYLKPVVKRLWPDQES